MKKTITILAILLTTLSNLSAQYQVAYKQAKAQERKGLYYKAILSYNAAAVSRDKPANNDLDKRINFCASKLNGLRIKAEKSEKLANEKINEITKLLNKFVPDTVKNIYQFAVRQANAFMTLDNQPYKKIDAYAEAIKFLSLAKYSSDKPNNTNINNIDKLIDNLSKCPQLLDQGNNYFFNNEFEKAKEIYRKVLELNPKSKTAYLMSEFCKPISQHFMVSVNAGRYRMYDDNGGKSYITNISKKYQISAYEITNVQYARFLNEYKSISVKLGKFKDEKMINLSGGYNFVKCRISVKEGRYVVEKGYECFPVAYVSWHGAYEYAQFYKASLPTEAQWEYAAAGGQKMEKDSNSIYKKQYLYAGSKNINEVAWITVNSEQHEHFVGLKKSNQLGLFDMSGNFQEWCFDWKGEYPLEEKTDYAGVETINMGRILRGGTWDDIAYSSSLITRSGDFPNHGYNSAGFRIVLINK